MCKIFEVINHACPTGLDSSKMSELPMAIIKIFNKKHKSKISDQWKDEKNKLNEKDMLVFNCFYVSVNVLSTICETSEWFDFDEWILFWIFNDFSHFLCSNFISQRICEALLYYICNVVDKGEKGPRIFWSGINRIWPFDKCFNNPRASTEIKLASAFILSHFIGKNEFKPLIIQRKFEHFSHLKTPVLEYLQSILEMPAMKKFKTFCGFKEEEIVKCIDLLGKLIYPYLFLVPVFS